jgi:hypothetical protein
MVYGFELEIHRLLRETDNTVKVADELLKRWDRGELSWKDQEVAAEFLLNAGFLSAFFQQTTKAVKTRQRLPWGCLFEAFARAKVRLTKDEIDQILVGAGEDDSLSDLCRSHALDAIDPRFARIRANVRAERRAKSLAPAPQQHTIFESDRTRPMVQNIKARKATLAEWAKRADELSPDLKEKFSQIAASMISHAKADRSSAYDISISLRFMGLPHEALEAIKFAKPAAAVLWLELDLLLETERYVEVLEKADFVERKLTNDPEASFSTAYARATALHALGETQRARDLLEGIVKVRPNYRSAHSLLMKWKAEEK